MSKLRTLIEDRIRAAKGEEGSARVRGDFNAQDWNSDLAIELQGLLDRATDADSISLNKHDAELIADFLQSNEDKFVDLLVNRRVSLAGLHSLNLMNQLRDHKG